MSKYSPQAARSRIWFFWGLGLLASLNLTGRNRWRARTGSARSKADCRRVLPPKVKNQRTPSSAAFASEEIWFVGANGINQPALAAHGLDASFEPLKDCSRGTRLS